MKNSKTRDGTKLYSENMMSAKNFWETAANGAGASGNGMTMKI